MFGGSAKTAEMGIKVIINSRKQLPNWVTFSIFAKYEDNINRVLQAKQIQTG